MVIAERDARWLAALVRHAIAVDYYRDSPHLDSRARELVEQLTFVANLAAIGGHSLDAAVSYADAAAMLSVSTRTIRRYIAGGRLPTVRVDGGAPRIPVAALAAHLQEAS